ncbi:hypothetical protein (partial), partial [Candidatus Ichthyocystis hellenicum]
MFINSKCLTDGCNFVEICDNEVEVSDECLSVVYVGEKNKVSSSVLSLAKFRIFNNLTFLLTVLSMAGFSQGL